MMIYHYTTIQTLALILKHKTIRFNRLDRVDDMEESIYGSGPLETKLGMYTFVSCWTKSDKENLALWNMYTRYRGVRIGLDEQPFIAYQINDRLNSFFKEPIVIKSDYCYTCFLNEVRLYDIEYVDNPQSRIKNIITQLEGNKTYIGTPYVGLFKRQEWAIQQESRFKICVLPISNDVNNINQENALDYISNAFDSIGHSLANNKPISITYMDMPLNLEKMNSIEVLLGPMTTEADRVIVESLLSPFSKAVIRDSFFKGKLRDKH